MLAQTGSVRGSRSMPKDGSYHIQRSLTSSSHPDWETWRWNICLYNIIQHTTKHVSHNYLLSQNTQYTSEISTEDPQDLKKYLVFIKVEHIIF